jgi:hypothetical protein
VIGEAGAIQASTLESVCRLDMGCRVVPVVALGKPRRSDRISLDLGGSGDKRRVLRGEIYLAELRNRIGISSGVPWLG